MINELELQEEVWKKSNLNNNMGGFDKTFLYSV